MITKAKIIDLVLRFICLAVGICLFFWWSNRQVEKRVAAECSLKQAKKEIVIIEQTKKEVENVAHKKAVIHSKPNANRDGLLKLMRAGQL